MTITYPRDLMAYRFANSTFRLDRVQAKSPGRGGLAQVVELGPATWHAVYETPALGKSDALAWSAWLASLRGGVRLFKMVDPWRQAPHAHPSYAGLNRAGGGSFDGTCALADVGVAFDTLDLETLPVGFTLTPGDLVSFVTSTYQALHEVIEGGAANGSGDLTVTVEPAVRPTWTPGATVSLYRPWCIGVIDATSQAHERRAADSRGGSVRFEATQVLY